MKSILFINDLLHGGGVEVVMKNLVSYLKDKDYTITIMTFDENYNDLITNNKNIKIVSARSYLRKYGRKHFFKWMVEKIKYHLFIHKCKRQYYDIVIGMKEGPCTKLASYFKGGKRLSWIHVDYSYLYWTKGSFGKNDSEIECLRRLDNVICVSEAAQKSLIETIGDPNNTLVRYNPIDYQVIIEKSNVPCDLSRLNSKFLFVSVGRVTAQKNFIMLCKICSKLQKAHDFELWIIGDGDEMNECKQVLEKCNCNSVRLLGSKDNPYNYIKQADVLVSTAIWESYGLAIQEALILRVPVITTRCPAIEECFDTRYGIITDCEEEAVYNSMKYVLENPEIIQEYKENIKNNYKAEELWIPRLKAIEELFS